MIELNVTKNTNTAIPGTAGLYYPRVEYKGTLEMKDLAKLLSKHSTTFTQGEMIGVLTDAAQLIKEKILDGYVVKIEDLGLFKATVEGNGLKLEQGAKISAGVGSQRKAEDLAEDITLQQSAIGAIIHSRVGSCVPAVASQQSWSAYCEILEAITELEKYTVEFVVTRTSQIAFVTGTDRYDVSDHHPHASLITPLETLE